MTNDEVLTIFQSAGALLEGHFVLTSGRHSRTFLQKAFVFMNPQATEVLCKGLAALITQRWGQIDYVVSPAVGGIIPGYETARQLGAKAVYVEREDGQFRLRRGFSLPAEARVVIVEDIVTTGISVRETLEAIKNEPFVILGAAVIIDRSAGRADVGCELVALASIEIESFAPDDIPADLRSIPAIKPGSRALTHGLHT
ncbi:orotate phosphoribosyltransferase [Candidatus Phycosocius spiralis]|uniref:Orotate phosphoribosyltransferase n=1 Tax=Candidatus Phycosocius spiralis TaxID=2815099 RepID=A0ABQ4PS97_9PROT|nr:orotate phosphoribosyltransferase [Candidatus Phycosocius spiralis]GIU65858.1 orotate phosphoribosyltransferase [Candidatus Phycosocius spiralis]